MVLAASHFIFNYLIFEIFRIKLRLKKNSSYLFALGGIIPDFDFLLVLIFSKMELHRTYTHNLIIPLFFLFGFYFFSIFFSYIFHRAFFKSPKLVKIIYKLSKLKNYFSIMGIIISGYCLHVIIDLIPFFDGEISMGYAILDGVFVTIYLFYKLTEDKIQNYFLKYKKL